MAASDTNTQQLDLPPDTKVTVVITSEDCNYLQRTVIVWPDGSVDQFESDTPATGAGKKIEYGRKTMTTGKAPQLVASVSVFDRLPSDTTWEGTLTRKSGTRTVQSEGHRNPERQNWNDTVITFSW